MNLGLSQIDLDVVFLCFYSRARLPTVEAASGYWQQPRPRDFETRQERPGEVFQPQESPGPPPGPQAVLRRGPRDL